MLEHVWALTVLFFCAYLGLACEKLKGFRTVSAVVIAMVSAALLSNLHVIPTESPLYDIVSQYIVALAIPFFLYKANFKVIKQHTGAMLIVFLFASVGTVIGSLFALYSIDVGPETLKIISMFTASYIGGSINYGATSQVLQLQDHNLFVAGTAADNVIMLVYFVILGLVANHRKLDDEVVVVPTEPLAVSTLCLGLLLSFVFFTLALSMQSYLPIKGTEILLITLLTLIFVQIAPKISKTIIPIDGLGIVLMQVYFAIIGASCNVSVVIQQAPWLFLIVLMIVICQFSLAMIASKFTKASIPEALIACNAATGGPTTAIAMAANQGWQSLVVPAALCGTLGYALGTFIGSGFGWVLGI